MRATPERPSLERGDEDGGATRRAGHAPALVRVTTAAQAAARDRAAIDAGTPSRALMGRAGAAAAAEIARRHRDLLAGGVAVFAGPGNNGGDAWVVAAALSAAGVSVRVAATDSRTGDCAAERAAAAPVLGAEGPHGGERLVVDGLLGTGATGEPRGEVASLIDRVRDARTRGATVVALDVPSGVDATTGKVAALSVTADLTLTFGTVKRGLLAARDAAGAIVVLDIGLGAHASLDDGAPPLVDARWVAARVRAFGAAAHKGTRKRVTIVGGGEGMAGAAVLAARAAFRSGVGLVRLSVAPPSVVPVQATVPEAIATRWPDDDAAAATTPDADAIVIGPGLGRGAETRRLIERIIRARPVPIVVDADGLNDFEGEPEALGSLLAGRPAILTPHPAEAARLVGSTAGEVDHARYDVAADLARRTGACVLLKGVPTVIAAPDGRVAVSAVGTPVLAVAGSGDLLSGVVVTLLAQLGDPFDAATCAAWAHGRAGELASHGRPARGVTLDDVARRLGDVWVPEPSACDYPVLAELPDVAGARQ